LIENVAQIDHGKNDEMSAKKVNLFSVEPDYQSSEFIDPGKRSLTDEPVFVNFLVEKSLRTTFGGLAVAFILINIGDDSMIKAGFTCHFGVKSSVCIEKCASAIQSQVLDGFESSLQMGLEIVSIIVVTSN